ncbi:Phosphoserine phosphatase [Methanosarcinaceae archaeon Ag5]|uniref:phosphoserine phosphatase n=1 Tax=Methanolapillus africanus TaxID=3028297 RepID=A0AAE4MKP9_9EURY|nr:Phosphoserine phosphatase [Methanosarcinaceae archaeon Ag5]
MNCSTCAAPSFKLFVFDMDSTLIDAEVIDELAAAAGAADEVSQITRLAMNGEMDYTESFLKRVAFLKDLPYEKAMASVDKIQIMPGAPELIEYIHSIGGKTAMITCGFSVAADRFKHELNIDYVFSNELVVKDGLLTGEAIGPLRTTNSKEKVFEKIVDECGFQFSECVVVGDGANDVCLFKRAGFSIAFNAKPSVQQQANIAVHEKDLRCLIPILKDLII